MLKSFTAISLLCLIILVSTAGMLPAASGAGESQVKIGVLAMRGAEHCLKQWTPTVSYLSAKIPGKTFILTPLAFDEISGAVESGAVDFILANSSIYVELESVYGANRIATMKNWSHGMASGQFGGVIFCRADRQDIRRLLDLKGKIFMAVDETSLGGWRMAWRELNDKGIDPYRDFKELSFGGTHDTVVYAVRDRVADAGTVRTDTLEDMAAEGKIKLDDFFIIHDHLVIGDELPFAHSTRAYPEWPMAKVRHTSDELAEAVALALLSMPSDSPAAKAANIAGWTIPLNYQQVNDCLKELKLGPYQDYGKITPLAVLKKYWAIILLLTVTLVGMMISSLVILRLHRRIKQSHNELDQIFNTAAGGMRVVDKEFNMVRINETFMALCGFSEAEIKDKKCYDIFPGEFCHTPDCPLLRILNGGEQRLENEAEKVCKDDHKIPCNVVVTPFKGPDGEILGIIEDFRDISERKRLEQQVLQQKQREAQQAAMAHSGRMAALGQMATAMAHEINQPLSVISIKLQGWELLQKRGRFQPEKVPEDLAVIRTNLQRITRLIEHVRNFGRTDHELVPTDLVKVVEDALSLCRHQFKVHGIELQEEYGENLDSIMAAPLELEQVVLNLLVNARQATKARKESEDVSPWIKIRVQQSGERLSILVEDNGGGVPAEKVPFIFDPFFTTKPASKGTGLGLHISQQIMEKFNGGLTLHNRPGEGATFEAWFERG